MNYSGNTFTLDLEKLANQVYQVSFDTRVIRPLFKLYGKQGGFVTNIIGHRVDPGVDPGSPLTVSTTQNLSPVTLSCDFQIEKAQYSDEDTLNCLAAEAAYRVAAAEEAVILLGKGAKEFLEGLNVKSKNLSLQEGLLPSTGKVKNPILDSINQGISNLGTKAKNRRLRNYVVIVSLDLYQQAFKNRQTSFDAPIYEIRPLLIKDGFLYSQALPPSTGVLLSLSGDPVKIAVPIDATPYADSEQKDTITLRVEEQIRLLVDVPEAVVTLT